MRGGDGIVAHNINILGDFLGKRDVEELTREALHEKYGFSQADVMVLFGGSILCGGDVLAAAMKENVAKKYIIVGGAGHTTPTFRKRVQKEIPALKTEGLSEAEIFDAYLKYKYSLSVDFLETESTNCGNNITYLLDLIEREQIACNSIILSQDATMQYRMAATLMKYRPDITIINYATYQASVKEKDEKRIYETDILGMWDMNHYITLLLGEIPRLTDDENGYGPKGKGYIAHIDIPDEITDAFQALLEQYQVREANPEFASKR